MKSIKGSKLSAVEITKVDIMHALDCIYLSRIYEVLKSTERSMSGNSNFNIMNQSSSCDKFYQLKFKSSQPPLLGGDLHMFYDPNIKSRNLHNQKDNTIGDSKSSVGLTQLVSKKNIVSENNGVCTIYFNHSKNSIQNPENTHINFNKKLNFKNQSNTQTKSISNFQQREPESNKFLQFNKNKNKHNMKKNEKLSTKKDKDCTRSWSTKNTEVISNPPEAEKIDGNDFCEVVCMYRESINQYWVLNVSDVPTYEMIQRSLSKISHNEEIVDPEVNTICGCEYEGELFRAKVLNVLPKLRVHFIDFGNIHIYNNPTICKKLSHELINVPDLVYLIEFENGTPNRYNTEKLDSHFLTVKKLRKTPNNVYIVKIIEGPFGKTKINENKAPQQLYKDELLSNVKLSNQLSQKKLKSKDEIQTLNTFHLTSYEKAMTTISEKSKSIKKRYEINYITQSSKGTIFFLPGFNNTRFGIVVLEKHGDSDAYFEKILNFNSSNICPTKAKAGDLVLISYTDGNDCVGKIINECNGSYYAEVMNSDIFVEVNEVYPLPEEFDSVYAHEVIFTAKDCLSEIEEFTVKSNFEITSMAEGNNRWSCCLKSLKNENIITVGTIENALETVFGEFISLFLKSECTVEIAAIGLSNTLYVRKIGAKINQKQKILNEKLAAHAATAKNLMSSPKVGYICCSKYENDDLFYRAQVITVDNEKAKVLLVDLGLVQNTEWKKLKCLSYTLQKLPFLAIEISLANVSKEPFEPWVINYFENLITKKVKCILSYKTYLENVVLREKTTGLNINDYILKLRCTKKESKECVNPDSNIENTMIPNVINDKTEKMNHLDSRNKDRFYHFDLIDSDITCGKTYDLLILHVNQIEFEDKASFWAADRNDPNLVYVNTTLSEEIKTFCESSCEPYKPNKNELCLAQFEGSWYRGVVLEASMLDDCFLVLFTDFGNTSLLSSEFIRKTKAEFINAPVLALSCSIVNYERVLSNLSLKKKIFDFLKNKTNECLLDVKFYDFKDSIYEVEIPDIESIIVEKQ